MARFLRGRTGAAALYPPTIRRPAPLADLRRLGRTWGQGCRAQTAQRGFGATTFVGSGRTPSGPGGSDGGRGVLLRAGVLIPGVLGGRLGAIGGHRDGALINRLGPLVLAVTGRLGLGQRLVPGFLAG